MTNASLNLSAPRAGPLLTVPRRALVASAANATDSARFVYAIGGDNGSSPTTPYNSAESAQIDVFGNIGAFSLQRYKLGTAGRSFAAATTIGKYIYQCGGTDA